MSAREPSQTNTGVSLPDHTPGPWEAIPPSEHHGWYVEDGLGRTICDLYYLNGKTGAVIPHGLGYGEDGRNARSIAALPDLLEGLMEAVEFAERTVAIALSSGYPTDPVVTREMVSDWRRAIQKALSPEAASPADAQSRTTDESK